MPEVSTATVARAFSACQHARASSHADEVVGANVPGASDDWIQVADCLRTEALLARVPRAYVVVAPERRRLGLMSEYLADSLVAHVGVTVEQRAFFTHEWTGALRFVYDGCVNQVYFLYGHPSVDSLPAAFCGRVSLLIFDYERVPCAVRAALGSAIRAHVDTQITIDTAPAAPAPAAPADIEMSA